MASETTYYRLLRLTQGDSLSASGYKFTDADRVLIDRLLFLGAEGHQHTGASATANNPAAAPTLTLNTTGGLIPADTVVSYKFTYVSAGGDESTGSPEAIVITPSPVPEPGAATLTVMASGGTLVAGSYGYALSAYVSVNTTETRAAQSAVISVASGSTNQITVDFPTLPSGATGFNIYRRKPGQTKFFYVTSVDLDVATPPTEWVDTGAIAEDCDRGTPASNSTNSTNSVVVEPPSIPVGYNWRVYRTYSPGDYTRSLLANVDNSLTTYTDTGTSTTSGSPPTVSTLVNSPSKIDLGDGAEVQGSLPLGMTGHPYVETFQFVGSAAAVTGTVVWVCPFPAATIVACRAALGSGVAGSGATPTDIVFDVNKYDANSATPTWATIYTVQDNRPTIAGGEQVGVSTEPVVRSLLEGDLLSVDIDDIGNSVGTALNPIVEIYMIVHGYPTDTSFVAGSTTGTGF